MSIGLEKCEQNFNSNGVRVDYQERLILKSELSSDGLSVDDVGRIGNGKRVFVRVRFA